MARSIGEPSDHSHTGSDDGGAGVGPTDVNTNGRVLTDPGGIAHTGALQTGGAERSHVRASNTGNQSIAAGTTERLNLDKEISDNLGEFDPAAGSFVPAETGVYSVVAQARFQVGADQDSISTQLWDYTNGVPVISMSLAASGTGAMDVMAHGFVELTAGVDYGVRVHNFNSSDTIEGSDDDTFLNIVRFEV